MLDTTETIVESVVNVNLDVLYNGADNENDTETGNGMHNGIDNNNKLL